jgi:hypothetical protein
MGLHTGTAEERDGDHFGPAVNRAARIMAPGHGGQVPLSLANSGGRSAAPLSDPRRARHPRHLRTARWSPPRHRARRGQGVVDDAGRAGSPPRRPLPPPAPGRRRGIGRHETLQATAEWSDQLLADDERLVFARLMVFAGGCDLAAADRCGSRTRFLMLETLRRYGAEHLRRTGPTPRSGAGTSTGTGRWRTTTSPRPRRSSSARCRHRRARGVDPPARHPQLGEPLGPHGDAGRVPGRPPRTWRWPPSCSASSGPTNTGVPESGSSVRYTGSGGPMRS